MAAGFWSKFFGSLSVFCLMAASSSGSHMFGFLGKYEQWSWSYAIPWIIATMIFGGLASSIAKNIISERQDTENGLAQNSTLPFFILLRPFAIENLISVKNPDKSGMLLFPSYHYEDASIGIERLISQALKPDKQLRVIGGSPTGPGILNFDNPEWKNQFHQLIKDAIGIIVIPLPGTEILWECEQLINKKLLSKTIFIIPSIDQVKRIYSEKDISNFYNQINKIGFQIPLPNNKILILKLSEHIKIINQKSLRKLTYNEMREILRLISLQD